MAVDHSYHLIFVPYIRATFNLKELQRSGCAYNRNKAPVDVALIDLYQWTTVNGYIDNITVS